jgi:glycosyltransferase involved in cell wall biosynthesis
MSGSYYWSRPEVKAGLQVLDGRRYDLVRVNDIAALPLGLRIARGSPVLVDAHEYSPQECNDKLAWRLTFGKHYHYLCRRYLPQAAAMTTVCAGIAEEYKRNYGVTATVIENAPSRQNLSPSNVEANRIRMIHHGGALRSRRLELMIEIMEQLDQRFSLDFMLVGDDERYIRTLRERAAKDPRIRFVPPVSMPDICRETNAYDIGLYLLPPANLNNRCALPNKLFEFIQARLAVAIGPSPEMARVVQEHGIGVVAKSFDPSDLAKALNCLTEQDLVRYKRASDAAAEKLCFETSAERLLMLIERLLTTPAGEVGTRPDELQASA